MPLLTRRIVYGLMVLYDLFMVVFHCWHALLLHPSQRKVTRYFTGQFIVLVGAAIGFAGNADASVLA